MPRLFSSFTSILLSGSTRNNVVTSSPSILNLVTTKFYDKHIFGKPSGENKINTVLDEGYEVHLQNVILLAKNIGFYPGARAQNNEGTLEFYNFGGKNGNYKYTPNHQSVSLKASDDTIDTKAVTILSSGPTKKVEFLIVGFSEVGNGNFKINHIEDKKYIDSVFLQTGKRPIDSEENSTFEEYNNAWRKYSTQKESQPFRLRAKNQVDDRRPQSNPFEEYYNSWRKYPTESSPSNSPMPRLFGRRQKSSPVSPRSQSQSPGGGFSSTRPNLAPSGGYGEDSAILKKWGNIYSDKEIIKSSLVSSGSMRPARSVLNSGQGVQLDTSEKASLSPLPERLLENDSFKSLRVPSHTIEAKAPLVRSLRGLFNSIKNFKLPEPIDI